MSTVVRKVLTSRDDPGLLSATVVVRPSYQDCDPAGVVWHGNYFHFFDRARCALLDKLDYGYRAMEASGHLWPIIDTRVRYIHAATYEQDYEVDAMLREWEYRMKIDYVVRDTAGVAVVEAYTTQVAVEIATGELSIAPPGAFVESLRRQGIAVD